MFLNNGVTLLTNSMTGIPMDISHIAIGDTPSIISLSDKTLQHEVFRKEISGIYTDGNSIYIEAFINTNEANFIWKDIALFSGGTMITDSGEIVAKSLVNEEKNDRKTVNITWEINIDRR